MEYFLILLAVFLIALFFENKYHVHLYKSRQERIKVTLLFFVIGVIWDTLPFCVVTGFFRMEKIWE